MSQSHEFVVFKFVSGVDAAAQRTAMGTLGRVLAALPGFVRRDCYLGADGRWVDHVVWATRAQAEASTGLALADATAAAIFGQMDQNGLVFTHTELVELGR